MRFEDETPPAPTDALTESAEGCSCPADPPAPMPSNDSRTRDLMIEREAKRVLLADDDPVQVLTLKKALTRWGFVVEVHRDGKKAWEAAQREDAPSLLVLDWTMPGLNGDEICRRIRALRTSKPTYILMLTGRRDKEDIIAGLHAGADDYLQKPANREELRARIRNASRTIELQLSLAKRVFELEAALSKVKQLQGLLPICAYCKKIRSDNNYWQQVESYLSSFSDVRFSHGICPDCYERIVEPQLRKYEGP